MTTARRYSDAELLEMAHNPEDRELLRLILDENIPEIRFWVAWLLAAISSSEPVPLPVRYDARRKLRSFLARLDQAGTRWLPEVIGEIRQRLDPVLEPIQEYLDGIAVSGEASE